MKYNVYLYPKVVVKLVDVEAASVSGAIEAAIALYSANPEAYLKDSWEAESILDEALVDVEQDEANPESGFYDLVGEEEWEQVSLKERS